MGNKALVPLDILSSSGTPTGPTLQAGSTYYHSTSKTLRLYDGSAWVDLVNDETAQTIGGSKTFTSAPLVPSLSVEDGVDWYSYFDPQTIGIFASSGTYNGAQFEVAAAATIPEVNVYAPNATVGSQTRESQLVLGSQRWTGAATALETVTVRAARTSASAGAFTFSVLMAGTEKLTLSSDGILTPTSYFSAPAATTSIPSVRMPHGTAPSAPTNGDTWTTTAGLFVRINGTTVQLAPLASPTFTGTLNSGAIISSSTISATGLAGSLLSSTNPVINGTAAPGTATIPSRQDHVHPTDTTRSALASPTFTGTPAAPTAAVDTNTTQIATTAFVLAQNYSTAAAALGSASAGASIKWSRGDHVHPTTGLVLTTTAQSVGGIKTFTSEIIAPAATTGIPSIRMPHGTAPSTPTNGDVWTTTAGMYVRINGTTVGPLSAGGSFSYATTSELANVDHAAENAGASSTVARGDHKHDVNSATAIALTGSAGAGSSNSLALADHQHGVSGLVTDTGNQSIAGTKTFTGAVSLAHNGTTGWQFTDSAVTFVDSVGGGLAWQNLTGYTRLVVKSEDASVGTTTEPVQIELQPGRWTGSAQRGLVYLRGDQTGTSTADTVFNILIGNNTRLTLTEPGNLSVAGTSQGTALIPTGLTGATSASRYVGATTSGAPGSGTFSTGDFIIARNGKLWVCTAGGSPGTWADAGGSTPASTVTTLDGLQSAVVGTGTNYARDDHKHAVTNLVATTGTQTVAGLKTFTSLLSASGAGVRSTASGDTIVVGIAASATTTDNAITIYDGASYAFTVDNRGRIMAYDGAAFTTKGSMLIAGGTGGGRVLAPGSDGASLTMDAAQSYGAAWVDQMVPLIFSVNGQLGVAAGVARVGVEGTYVIKGVRARVDTAPTGSSIKVDVNKNGTTIWSTQTNRPDIATSSNASSYVTNMNTTSLSSGDYLTMDVDQIGSTIAGSHLTVTVWVVRVS